MENPTVQPEILFLDLVYAINKFTENNWCVKKFSNISKYEKQTNNRTKKKKKDANVLTINLINWYYLH